MTSAQVGALVRALARFWGVPAMLVLIVWLAQPGHCFAHSHQLGDPASVVAAPADLGDGQCRHSEMGALARSPARPLAAMTNQYTAVPAGLEAPLSQPELDTPIALSAPRRHLSGAPLLISLGIARS